MAVGKASARQLLLLVLVAALGVASAQAQEAQAPEGNGVVAAGGPTARVVGGVATERAFPWMVSIQRYGKHACGGTLIRPGWVLTAAHCVKYEVPPGSIVRNSYDVTEDSGLAANQGREVREHKGTARARLTVVHHPDYTHGTAHDMALIKVEPPFNIAEADLMPLSNAASDEATSNDDVHVLGWGYTEYGSGKTSPILRKVKVPLVTKAQCEKAYPGRIHEENVCAGEEGKDSCSGDSGGPLVRLDRGGNPIAQLGVVSWGRGCAWDGFYGVYSGVRAQRDFILATLNGEVPGVGGGDGPDDGDGPDGGNGDGDGVGGSNPNDPMALYEERDRQCGELRKSACRARSNAESCFFQRGKCRGHPMKELDRHAYCAILSTRTWCRLSAHKDTCEWVSGSCLARPTEAPTHAPTRPPTINSCKKYRRSQAACEADWSCQWDGSAKVKKRCVRRAEYKSVDHVDDYENDDDIGEYDDHDDDDHEEEAQVPVLAAAGAAAALGVVGVFIAAAFRIRRGSRGRSGSAVFAHGGPEDDKQQQQQQQHVEAKV